MGLPKIIINFTESAKTILPRSERGIVLVLAKTESSVEPLRYEIKSRDELLKLTELKTKAAKAHAYAESVFMAGAKRVIVHLINENNTLTDVLDVEKTTKYNYLVYPEIAPTENVKIIDYIKTERALGKGKKAILFDVNNPDESGIINFATENVEVDAIDYSFFEAIGTKEDELIKVAGSDYIPRIAGTLAGMSLARSSTYYELKDVVKCSISLTPDEDIDNGKLILINDGEKVKIARGVNSKITGTESFKKIKLIDGMDLILEDIKKIFHDEFIGKMTASYDNKMGFIDAINGIYFRGLKGTVLAPEFENKVEIDVEAIKNYLIERSIDPEKFEEAELRAYPTGSTLFLKGNIKLLDALEDLELNIVI